MNFYSLHIGDYASDTAHLSWQEDLAYRRLLDLYYLREQPISTDLKALCRLLRAREPELEAAVQTVLEEFFIATPEGWRHKRCDAEIAQYLGKRDAAARAAQRRWGPEEVKSGDAKLADVAVDDAKTNDTKAVDAEASHTKAKDALAGPLPFKGRDRVGMGFSAAAMPPRSSSNATPMQTHSPAMPT